MNSKQAASGVTAIVIILVLSGICAASVGLFGMTLDLSSGRIYNPEAEAEATRTTLRALDESRERQAQQQTRARQAEVEAEAAEAARDALVWRNRLLALALGLGGGIVICGGALALVTWAQKCAAVIYPNASGQYPLVVTRGWGWAALHDPARGLGPATVYQTPTLLDQIAEIVLAIQQRRAPALPQPEASFPATADNGTMLQIATQAQAGQVATAQNRWPKLPAVVGARVSISERGMSGLGDSPALPAPASRMPQVTTVIDDPVRMANMRQHLLECER